MSSERVTMETSANIVDRVVDVLVQTLGLEDRAEHLDVTTPLLGSLPELDSRAVVELAIALEERFDFEIDDEEFSGEIFETVGSLAAFVERSLR